MWLVAVPVQCHLVRKTRPAFNRSRSKRDRTSTISRLKPGQLRQVFLLSMNLQLCGTRDPDRWCTVNLFPIIDDPYEKQRTWSWHITHTSKLLWRSNNGRLERTSFSFNQVHPSERRVVMKLTSEKLSINDFAVNSERLAKIDQFDQDDHQYQLSLNSSLPWMPSKFNQHDASLCRKPFEWCWCGYVPSLSDYYDFKEQVFYSPKIVTDCRRYSARPYEKRNCKPETMDTRPWYKKLLFLSPNTTPCGKIWAMNHETSCSLSRCSF